MNMKCWLLLAGLLALPSPGHAHPMPIFDLDALLFSSESVVEGSISATHTRHYDLEADVRVEKTWAGTNLTGRTVTIGNLSLYYKGRSWINTPGPHKLKVGGQTRTVYFAEPEQARPLRTGDPALFFIYKPSSLSFALPEGTWWAISSGVYLVRPSGISGFTQRSNPGGYDEVPGTTRAHFNAAFAASWTRVKDLKAHLHRTPQKQDASYFQAWKKRRQKVVTDNHWFNADLIEQKVDERLQKIAQLSNATRQTP